MAGDGEYEFQRLWGMGEALYGEVAKDAKHPCRIYAPVGEPKHLLSYLIRRILENGANSSFVRGLWGAPLEEVAGGSGGAGREAAPGGAYSAAGAHTCARARQFAGL